MAATVTRRPSGTGHSEDVWGRSRVRRYAVSFVGDTSYPTGGEAVDFEFIDAPADATVIIEQTAPLTTRLVWSFDAANEKIVAFWVDTTVDGAALAQVADTTDLNAIRLNVTVIEA